MLKKINEEIVAAMKSKDFFRRDVLRMIKSCIEEESKKAKDKRTEIEVICAYYTKLEKATFIKNIAQDFIDKTKREMAIVKEFMPQEISVDEAYKILDDYLSTVKPAEINKGILIAYVKSEGKKIGKIVSGRVAFMAVDSYMKKNGV